MPDDEDGELLRMTASANSSRLFVVSEEEEEENMDGDEEGLLRAISFMNSSRLSMTSIEEEEEDYAHVADSDDDEESMVDYTESSPSSRPGSPGPDTPTDDSSSVRSLFQPQCEESFVVVEDDETEKALAITIAKNAVEEYYRGASRLHDSLPVIEEEDSAELAKFSAVSPPLRFVVEDDEESLPPLDEWYLDIAARIVPVA